MFKTAILAAAATSLFAISFAPAAQAQSNTNNLRAFGLTDDMRLVSFRTGAPGLSARVVGPVTGLGADTSLVGIDFRVQDGKLYGVGDAGGVYIIDTDNATASLVNQLNLAGTPLALEGARFGVDFNPAADRLRIVSNSGQNLRHNVNAGGVTLVDGPLNNGAVPPVAVTGVASAAYTNNDNAQPLTGTVLFDITGNNSSLALQVPPNGGVISAVGALGFLGETGTPVALTGRVGFDIYTQTNRAGASIANVGFLTVGTTEVFSVDLSSGLATSLGSVRKGYNLVDIALPIAQ